MIELAFKAAGLGLIALAMTGPVLGAPDPLARHRWTHRLLVVAAPDARNAALAEQRRLFKAFAAGAQERDLVLVEAVGSGADAQAIRRRFDVPDGVFRAILVGKDGGDKLTSETPLGAEPLFREIDAMPMRADEMRRRR